VIERSFNSLPKYAMMACRSSFCAGRLCRGRISGRLLRWVASMSGHPRISEERSLDSRRCRRDTREYQAQQPRSHALTYAHARGRLRERFDRSVITAEGAIDNSFSLDPRHHLCASRRNVGDQFSPEGIGIGLLMVAVRLLHLLITPLAAGLKDTGRFSFREPASTPRTGVGRWSHRDHLAAVLGHVLVDRTAGVRPVYAIIVVLCLREVDARGTVRDRARSMYMTGLDLNLVSVAGFMHGADHRGIAQAPYR